MTQTVHPDACWFIPGARRDSGGRFIRFYQIRSLTSSMKEPDLLKFHPRGDHPPRQNIVIVKI
jgi:hypothetical protein